MSVERLKGKVAFLCDLKGCENGLETDTGDFYAAKDKAREEGWVYRFRDGEWLHFCCENHEEMQFRGQTLA